MVMRSSSRRRKNTRQTGTNCEVRKSSRLGSKVTNSEQVYVHCGVIVTTNLQLSPSVRLLSRTARVK